MRITVRVKPGSSRTLVGGRHDGVLVVAVNAQAVQGRASAAVERAVAKAFGLPSRSVRIVRGHTARTKILELDLDQALGVARLAELLGPGPTLGDDESA